MAGLTPQEFVSRWRWVTLKERSASQSHFIDLCRLVDQPTPTEADPTGDFYTFECGAEKSAGLTGEGHGCADVWKKGHFAWEYKGPRANLDKAYQQLQQYRESLENPPLLVVSDLQTIQVHTNFNNRDTGQVFLESVSSFLRSVSAFERPIEDDGPRIAPPEAPPER